MHKINIAFLALASFTLTVKAQEKPKSKTTATIAVPVKKTDSLPSAPKAYKQVITAQAKTSLGMFKVHQIGLRYFFEIPDSLLNRDLLVVNRISRSAAGPRPQMTGYAGDEIAENVISFQKGPDDRIFLKLMSFDERSSDSTANGMYKAVVNSNLQPIVASFPVKAYGKDTTGAKSVVIDVTDYLNSDSEIFYFNGNVKKTLSIGGIQADKSYISSISSYPMNVEVRTVRTYARMAAVNQTSVSTIPVTYELNSSVVLLPKTTMKPRFADSRVGYFGRAYIDFDTNPQGVKQSVMITRWRMEPKDEDIEKYKRGELVEPKKPIIYYIDPATPKKWVPYLIAGVNDWQKAFEQAGFKNAIIAMPAPANDSTWSIDDARHNVIVYKPSTVANASGPNVHDPRSGEIIETHINWYHNIMQLVRNWYMIQAGAVDPRARKMEFDDELMGQLIRFVSSHEVGHTLGLLHNFGSSSTVPVEKLRDKAFVEAHGHTPSIMDYARFNYVAQPEDGISEKGLFPRIGDYDKWAIEFGYKWLPQFNSAEAEGPYLNKLIIDSLSKDKRLYFGNEQEYTDPRSQSEDMGDNAMLASTYGIKNLKRILPQLKTWTSEPAEGYANLKAIYWEVVKQYQTYLGHVTRNVAGLYATPKSVEQPGPVFENVSYEKQKEAMRFLRDNVFNTPTWLLDENIFSLTGISPTTVISVIDAQVLSRLQGSDILTKLLNAPLKKGQ
ncbi:MAG TPA: zinc-dependent metalloprotease, partial [Pedobacter sp.]